MVVIEKGILGPSIVTGPKRNSKWMRGRTGGNLSSPRAPKVLAMTFYLLALKVKTTSSSVCAGPGAYFQRITACDAYSDNIGLPPLMSTFDTFPFGCTVASRR